MQATVFSHVPDGVTVVVTDSGLSHEVPPEVFAASELRFVRPGQRVSITELGGKITRMWIVGIGEDETIR